MEYSSRSPISSEESSSVPKHPANSSSDVNKASGYTYYEMVSEALSTINDENGVDFDGIFNFIKERYEVTPKLRERLRDKLNKLVSTNKLEKVENRYKIFDGITTISKEATKNEEDSIKQPQELPEVDETVRVVVAAEHYEYRAKEVFEAARISNLLSKESHLILKLATEILDLCTQGKKVFLR